MLAMALAGCGAAAVPRPQVALTPREQMLAEARHAARTGARDRARRLLEERLRTAPDDDEARAELARVDAWDGRWAASTDGYRTVLARHPDDADVRAGLADVLLWDSQLDEAARLIAEGLARSPQSAPLLLRRARIAHWRGDATAAARDLDEAQRAAPGDLDVRALRDAVFRGEARLTLRDDLFFTPGGVRDYPAADLEVLQAWRRFRFSVRTEHSLRFGADADTRSYNGLHALGVTYVPSAGWTVQIEFGVGAPAEAVPRWLWRVGAGFPIGSRFSGVVNYSHWRYDSGQVVHLFNPALGATLTDVLRVEARLWFALVSSPTAAGGSVEQGVPSVGARVSWRPSSRFELGGEYTWGTQLDRLPVGQLVAIRGHVISLGADVRASHGFGLRPLLRVELRTAPGDLLPIFTPELGFYTRW